MRELSGEASAIEWSRELWMTKCTDVSIQKVTAALSGAAPLEGCE